MYIYICIILRLYNPIAAFHHCPHELSRTGLSSSCNTRCFKSFKSIEFLRSCLGKSPLFIGKSVNHPTKSGWWLTYPSEKWWSSSVGMMKFPRYEIIKAMFRTTNQKWVMAMAKFTRFARRAPCSSSTQWGRWNSCGAWWPGGLDPSQTYPPK